MPHRRLNPIMSLVVALAVALAAPGAVGAAAAPDLAPLTAAVPGHAPPAAQAIPGAPEPDQYVVELSAPPITRYAGGVKDLAATAPSATHHPLAPASTAAQAWAQELDRRQDAVLAAVPGVRPDVSYRTAFSGFAAKLTPEEAADLAHQDGVAHVTPERFLQVAGAPDVAPDAIGGGAGIAGSEAQLMGLPSGLWRQLGGAAQAGRDTIVGVIDTGVTPESASFADHGLTAPASWDGACQAGDSFSVTDCSNKLIGARYFVDGYGAGNLRSGDYLSPRDENGHGTHVASIAVGDDRVDSFVDGNALGVGRITGVAPAAHLAVYKACWELGSCSEVDLISAIDSAVRDGVDVINLSVGNPQLDSAIDPLEDATRNADAAGVFVAVAAGNDGDSPGALGTPASAPWVTAVGATTGSRTFRSTLHLSARGQDPIDLPASGTWQGFDDVPVVDAHALDPDHAGSPYDDPRYCVEGYTREQVEGKIVVCDAFAPIELIGSGLAAMGAKGFILYAHQSTDDPIAHGALPSVVVTADAGATLRRVLDAAGGEGTLTAPSATATSWTPDRLAAFSSRGPGALSPDLLRPDVSAPGVNVLAAYAPNTFEAASGWETRTPFNVLSGTSMATPQVAGAAALLTQAHPTWSPAQMRSALETTARKTVDGATPDAAGSGRIDPTAAAAAGLVVAPTTDDYARFASGTLAARDLNLPSLQLGDADGNTVSVQRTLTSVASSRQTWTTSVTGADPDGGTSVAVTPSRLTIAPGQSAGVTVQARVAEGSPGFHGGAIVLRSQQTGQELRLPLAFRDPGIWDAPPEIDIPEGGAGDGASVTARVAGTVQGVGFGLAAPVDTPDLQTSNPEFDDLQEATIPVTLDQPADMVAVEALPQTKGAPSLVTTIYRDVDGDGRFTPLDQGASVTLPRDPANPETEADAAHLPAGKYLVKVFAAGSNTDPITYTLRTWTVRDPKPDDLDPSPGLRVDGDTSGASAAADHTFTLRTSGTDGLDAPLRGLVDWQGRDGAVLAESVVHVADKSAAVRDDERAALGRGQ